MKANEKVPCFKKGIVSNNLQLRPKLKEQNEKANRSEL